MLLVCVSLSVGAQIVGKLDCSGIGTPIDGESEKSLNELWYSCAERNASLVESLKVDPHADKLLEMAHADAELHRASTPVPISKFDIESCLLHPRFMVEQRRPDGSLKLRPIDHFSWSKCGKEDSVNGHVVPTEKLKHDTLDRLEALLRLFVHETGEVPALIKADIDTAFRRIPVAPGQRWVCGSVFRAHEQVGRVIRSYVI